MTIQELIQKDNTFSESGFLAKVDNTYIMILTSIMTENLKRVDHKVGNELYQQLTEKLNKLQSQNEIQMYDEINVAQTEILNYQVTNTDMIIKVYILSRYLDYLMDEDGNYVSGDTDVRSERANYLTFTKKINHKEMGSVRKCPGCGASIDVNASGKCAYCGTIYNLDDKDWVLTSIETK